jgi:hypothetical protein
VTKDFPKFITKWKEKRNINVQMITTKECDRKPKVAMVMRGGMRIRANAMDQGNIIHQWEMK